MTVVSGKDWKEMVLKIAAALGHPLPADSWKDQGIPEQFKASHAEKQLIAYFLDRHVFLSEDVTSDSRFDEEIKGLNCRIAMAAQSSTTPQFYHLQQRKRELELELFDKDDRLLGDGYHQELVE
ncbi:hypothetical protein AnigIFM49718_011344 [Aspergillus niger]|nr:hypothetical protein AnigIFM49718_011344 [Aspergillus niger]GLA21317.1 hypothetical protein AnigIFM62618_010624 [Aspergillus niger]